MVGGAPEQGLPGERDKHALDTSVPVLVEQLMSFSAWGINKSIWERSTQDRRGIHCVPCSCWG